MKTHAVLLLLFTESFKHPSILSEGSLRNKRGRKGGEGEGKGKRKRKEGGRKREKGRKGHNKSVELVVLVCSYSVWHCALRKCAFYESSKRDLDQMPVSMLACQLLVSSHPLALSSLLHLYRNRVQLVGAHSTHL